MKTARQSAGKRSAENAGPERLINAEAERLIIGNILVQPGFFRRVGPQLSDDCFAVESYRRVFNLARRIHESGGDPILSECYRYVLNERSSSEGLGLPQLSSLAFDNMVDVSNPEQWVRDLKSKAAERRIWKASERLRLGVESGADAAEQLAATQAELRMIAGTFDAPTATDAPTIGNAVFSIGIDNLLAAPRGCIPSPWARLNDVTNGGLRPGELWLVGARTGVGKSTACLQWALAAAKNNHRVLFASLEMPQADLLKRILSAEGDIPHAVLVRGDLQADWRAKVADTLERIGSCPLEISDKMRSLSTIIGKVAATPNLGLLVVDYLGLVDPGGRFENRNQEVSAISRRLKLAALDYNIPIVAAHQLNRANENESRRPQLNDLRDSGSLEQDADTVLLLDAPGNRDRADNADKDVVDLIIGKQRNGVRGTSVRLRLEGPYCRITEQ